MQGFLTRIPSRVDAFPHVSHGKSYEDAAGVGFSSSRRPNDRTRAGRRVSKDRPPARPCARKGPTWPTALNASTACIPAAGARWRVQTLVMKRVAMLDHGSSRGERRGPRCDPRNFLPPGRSGVCFSRNRSAPAPTKILLRKHTAVHEPALRFARVSERVVEVGDSRAVPATLPYKLTHLRQTNPLRYDSSAVPCPRCFPIPSALGGERSWSAPAARVDVFFRAKQRQLRFAGRGPLRAPAPIPSPLAFAEIRACLPRACRVVQHADERFFSRARPSRHTVERSPSATPERGAQDFEFRSHQPRAQASSRRTVVAVCGSRGPSAAFSPIVTFFPDHHSLDSHVLDAHRLALPVRGGAQTQPPREHHHAASSAHRARQPHRHHQVPRGRGQATPGQARGCPFARPPRRAQSRAREPEERASFSARVQGEGEAQQGAAPVQHRVPQAPHRAHGARRVARRHQARARDPPRREGQREARPSRVAARRVAARRAARPGRARVRDPPRREGEVERARTAPPPAASPPAASRVAADLTASAAYQKVRAFDGWLKSNLNALIAQSVSRRIAKYVDDKAVKKLSEVWLAKETTPSRSFELPDVKCADGAKTLLFLMHYSPGTRSIFSSSRFPSR